MPDTTVTLLAKLELLIARLASEDKTLRAELKAEIADAVLAAKNEILGGAGEAYDTLKEIEDFLKTNNDTVAAIQALKLVKYDVAQTLTSEEQAQARSNIGAADAATVSGQGTRLTTAEASITDHGTRLGAAETAIADLEASIGDLTGVDFVATYEAALAESANG